jgi:hypothetical protein
MREMNRNLESCGGHHSTLDTWRTRMRFVALMTNREFALSIQSTDMASRKRIFCYLNHHGYFERVPFTKSIPEFDVGFDHGQLQPTDLFRHPFTVELVGAGFDKPANSKYFALRFPRLLKIYEDRSFKGTVSFEELQEMAKRCREIPEDSEREETHWLRRLRGSSYRVERSRFSSPSNAGNLPLSQRRLRSTNMIVPVDHVSESRRSRRQVLSSRLQIILSSIHQSGGSLQRLPRKAIQPPSELNRIDGNSGTPPKDSMVV